MDELIKRFSTVITAVSAGLATGYVVARVYQKRKEKAIGGKLMRVNYRFTKEFDD